MSKTPTQPTPVTGIHEQRIIEAHLKRLTRQYRLKSTKAFIPSVFWHLGPQNTVDHTRLYRTGNGGYLIAVSNYGDALPPIALGMEPYDPIYSLKCTTFIRVFRDAKAMRFVIKRAYEAEMQRQDTPPFEAYAGIGAAEPSKAKLLKNIL